MAFQESEDLFPFIPNRPFELSNSPELEIQGKDVAGCCGPIRHTKRQNKLSLHTIMKKPSKKAVKIIKIEVYDTQMLENEQSSGEPEICIQYVVSSIFDNVYCDTRKIIQDIQDSMYK